MFFFGVKEFSIAFLLHIHCRRLGFQWDSSQGFTSPVTRVAYMWYVIYWWIRKICVFFAFFFNSFVRLVFIILFVFSWVNHRHIFPHFIQTMFSFRRQRCCFFRIALCVVQNNAKPLRDISLMFEHIYGQSFIVHKIISKKKNITFFHWIPDCSTVYYVRPHWLREGSGFGQDGVYPNSLETTGADTPGLHFSQIDSCRKHNMIPGPENLCIPTRRNILQHLPK